MPAPGSGADSARQPVARAYYELSGWLVRLQTTGWGVGGWVEWGGVTWRGVGGGANTREEAHPRQRARRGAHESGFPPGVARCRAAPRRGAGRAGSAAYRSRRRAQRCGRAEVRSSGSFCPGRSKELCVGASLGDGPSRAVVRVHSRAVLVVAAVGAARRARRQLLRRERDARSEGTHAAVLSSGDLNAGSEQAPVAVHCLDRALLRQCAVLRAAAGLGAGGCGDGRVVALIESSGHEAVDAGAHQLRGTVACAGGGCMRQEAEARDGLGMPKFCGGVN